MEYWFNFLVVGAVAFAFFIACAFSNKRISDIPYFLLLGIIVGLPIGLISDFVLWGTYSYPIGYGKLYLILNAAVIYGLLAATVLLLQQVRILTFITWIVAMAAAYEITNYFFPVWIYHVTPFLGLLAFVLLGYTVTAFFIATIAHLFFRCKFRSIDMVIK